jgi:protein-L-isoaspartate(D-aspartate) O-methyltransferase
MIATTGLRGCLICRVPKRVMRLATIAGLASAAGCASDRATERYAMVTTMTADVAHTPLLARDPVFNAALATIAGLPRERFAPKAAASVAYLGTPLNIGWDQTISDPYIMAVMTAAARVRAGANVLEIGTGSGYQAAILAKLGARVSTIEIVPQLARRAATVLASLRIRGVTIRTGDGFAGWPDRAPFDAVIVTAGAAEVPKPLLAQLRIGGRLVMPIGVSQVTEQIMVYERRTDGSFAICNLGWAMFVPLTGQGQTAERAGLRDRSHPFCYGMSVT